jgi:hypothetical protein
MARGFDEYLASVEFESRNDRLGPRQLSGTE